nr:MAG TPA: hypothetical protein [Caudoviricetes sp.]
MFFRNCSLFSFVSSNQKWLFSSENKGSNDEKENSVIARNARS